MRYKCKWYNPTGDFFWNDYYLIVWIITAAFVLLVVAAFMNTEPRRECICGKEEKSLTIFVDEGAHRP